MSALAFLVFLPALALWTAFRSHTGIVLEDALITYRYAENIAEGRGFVFNTGERVLGTTTPLYTLLLASAGRLLGADSIPSASAVLLAVFGQLAGLMTYAALRAVGLGVLPSALAVLLVLVHPDVAVAASGGMETVLVLALMAGSLFALCTRRHGAAVVLCALLVIARVDGAIWAAVVLAYLFLEERGAVFRRAALFAAVLLPWLAFAYAYFGSALPHSVVAKRAVAHAYLEKLGALHNLSAHLMWSIGATGGRVEYGVAALSPSWVQGLVFPVFAVLIGAGAVRVLSTRRTRPLGTLVVFPPALCLAYLVGRAPRIFDWYLTPAVYCCGILLAIGMTSLWHWSRARVSGRAPRAVAVSLMIGIVAGHLVFDTHHAWRYHRRYQQVEDTLRRALGEWLAAHTPEDATVATEAIGYLGYYSDRRILDLAGIVSPEVVAIHRESDGNAEAFQRILTRLEPDYLVLRSFEVDRNRAFFGGPLFEGPEPTAAFRRAYAELRRFRSPHSHYWGKWGTLTLYARRAEDVPR